MSRLNLKAVSLVENNRRPGGVHLVNTAMVNRVDDPNDLVALAQQVQKADEFTKANCGNKLQVIVEQIRFLQQQAKTILEDAKTNADLHHVACNMVKKPGTVYHLYLRDSGQKYLSILNPEEWGASCPHQYLGTYRLEYDMSWTPQEKFESRGQDIAMIDQIMHAQLAVQDSTDILMGKSCLAEKSEQSKVMVEEIDPPSETRGHVSK